MQEARIPDYAFLRLDEGGGIDGFNYCALHHRDAKARTLSKFVVTGAAGYIGRHVVNALVEEGHEVLSFVRDSSQVGFPSKVNVIESDLWGLDLNTHETYLRGSTLIHLAWQDGFVHTSDAHMGQLSNHYRFVRNIIELRPARVVVLGSMHELGPQTGEVSEHAIPNPQTQYGIAKSALRLSVEELCGRFGVEFLWLRCFYVMGDDARNHSVFTKLLELEAAGKKTAPLTAGASKFDFIEVDELGRVIALVSAIGGLTGVLNLGSGKTMTLRERLELFREEQQLKIDLDFGAFPERVGISGGCWPNLSRLEMYLPQTS